MNNRINWKVFLAPYVKAVEELKVKFKSIRKEYLDMGEYSPIEFVTGRVKKVSTILEKADKRQIGEENIFSLIEDIAGIRIMCQFVDDIYKVVELIKQRDGKDLTILYEKDYVKHVKNSGYKSYHIIIRYPIQTTRGTVNILAEIQIRTLAMNFWATIEHSINYKYRGDIPQDISERLKKTSKIAHLLDMEMCKIRDEVVGAQVMFETKSKLVREINDLLKFFEKNGDIVAANKFEEELKKLSDINDIAKWQKLLNDMYDFRDSRYDN